VDGVIRRTTAFQRLNRQPDSRASRELVTSCLKYGLTTSSWSATQLELTEQAKALFTGNVREQKEMAFNLAIERIGSFKGLYDRLKDKRFPSLDVLADQVQGVPDAQRKECASIFSANVRYLGLVRDFNGSERLDFIEEVLKETDSAAPFPTNPESSQVESASDVQPVAAPAIRVERSAQPTKPNLHLDINIHIDADATPEVIEQIFASMAKHIHHND
jgi:hypothetical protein